MAGATERPSSGCNTEIYCCGDHGNNVVTPNKTEEVSGGIIQYTV